MLKRSLILLSFVTALCVAGFVATDTAQAGHGCGYGSSHYGGYGGGYGYRSYYGGAPYYGHGFGPRTMSYRSYGHRHHDHYHHDHHRHHGHGGVSVSFGF